MTDPLITSSSLTTQAANEQAILRYRSIFQRIQAKMDPLHDRAVNDESRRRFNFLVGIICRLYPQYRRECQVWMEDA